ncbi:MAG TPA: 4Fe-4S dicluster domain-containing protein [Rhodanobacteraceae bacterium]|nr:4Fe-4S dicluster domain-containing protein [Rhodanobacteraceae bacterium]
MDAEIPNQKSCVHCGECVRACPEALEPEALFFVLVRDGFAAAHTMRLDACSECNRCVEVCPSHIPLLDWFRWGKSELREHARAGEARRRFLARNARLARERGTRAARRREAASPVGLPAQTISRAEVLAAIARGKAKVRAIVPDRRTTNSPPIPDDKNS